ncbi:CE1759 family FMN reductase [Raineyella sp. LH-20]|uniref:CE1759 family FMN reductase n=1 Tax=Raineyella sp. LH-20 TaxID=3081204 RepID=UPI00295552DA|nr:CE1759 family FMN reductase [Raineyella sp. LH-20]WOP19672.1 NAD(P)H-dependent oxidoreductase [Raineyella sp. LH-20]
MTRRLAVISAGVGTPSSSRLLADRITDAVRSQVGARGEDVRVDVIEVRELAASLATMTTAAGLPIAEVEHAHDIVRTADGVVAVTPVFSASYAGIFKMFWDTFQPDDLDGIPVLIGATAGTPRHSLVLDHAMRPLFTYFRMRVVPTGVFAATEDFGAGAGGEQLTRRIVRAATELAGLMVTTADAVEGFVPTGPAAHGNRGARSNVRDGYDISSITPFTHLLAGHDGN